jgi:hypothetical protein
MIWTEIWDSDREGLPELIPFVGLASEWEDEPQARAVIESDILREATSLLRTYGVSIEVPTRDTP